MIDSAGTIPPQPIRIVHVVYTTKRGGGLQRVVFELLRGLDPARFEQYLVAYRREDPELDLTSIRLLPTTSVTDARQWRQQRRFAHEVARHVRQNSIDIVHCHITRHTRWLMLRSRLAGARFIRTLHITLQKPETRFGLVARFWNRLASATTVCGPALVPGVARAWGLRQDEVTVVTNGIDLDRFSVHGARREETRRALGLRPDDIFLFSMGRLEEVKRHDVQIRAMAEVRKTLPNCRLLIAGTGRLEESLRALIRELRLDGNVTLLGNRDDVPELLDACDIFTLSTRLEGLPLSVIEAMAARRPVVVTAAEGMEQVVEDGVTGLIVPVGDAAAFASAVLRLARDPGMRRRLGEAGRARAEREFSLAAMLDRYARLYGSVMAGRAR